MRITGTFLDGLPCDIPSQNWGSREWEKQFDVFKGMGMDTVVIIRVGSRERGAHLAMYDSTVMKAPVCDRDDLVALFLDLAERNSLRLYMGLYDAGHWQTHDNQGEVAVNLELIDELLERYGQHRAFYGWYLSHEPGLELRPWEIWDPLVRKLRAATPEKPILLSPRYEGCKWERSFPADEYARLFDEALGHMTERIDAAAFMDGHVDFHELGDYAGAMKGVLDRHGIAFWSNIETFDRDMPFGFPPIDWQKMRVKMEAVAPLVSKIITFEAPHFLSPYSMWESGRMLYARYMEYVKNEADR